MFTSSIGKLFSLVAIWAILVSADSAQAFQDMAATTPVRVQSVVLVAPANSRISFVGTHVGDDPKPRLGGFKNFSGHVVVDPTAGNVTSMMLDIHVDSVWTQFDKLTGHLKNADFFDTAKFPTAQFASTKVESTGAGSCNITGNLTLHGVTKAVTFPARYQVKDGACLLNTKFMLDRSQFGMDQMLGGVEKMVQIEVFVGQRTTASDPLPGHGGGSRAIGSQGSAAKSGAKGSATKGSATKGSATKGSETKGSDAKGSGAKGSNSKDQSSIVPKTLQQIAVRLPHME